MFLLLHSCRSTVDYNSVYSYFYIPKSDKDSYSDVLSVYWIYLCQLCLKRKFETTIFQLFKVRRVKGDF